MVWLALLVCPALLATVNVTVNVSGIVISMRTDFVWNWMIHRQNSNSRTHRSGGLVRELHA